MTEYKKVPEENVACKICLKEIPVSSATSAEGADYFLYFCGAECFTQWEDEESDEKINATVVAEDKSN